MNTDGHKSLYPRQSEPVLGRLSVCIRVYLWFNVFFSNGLAEYLPSYTHN